MRNITTSYNNKGKIKHWYILLFCALFSLGNMFPIYAIDKKGTKTTDLFDIVTTRIQDEFEGKINLSAVEARIPTHLLLYNAAEGSFSDVNYEATDRTNWPPLEHIEKLYDLTYAYTMVGNIYYEDASILKIIEEGFEFWVNKNPDCSNWWYNQVGEPQRVGRILLQLRRGKVLLAQATEDKVVKRMKDKGGNPASQAGPNKTDVALHWLYRSCLTKDMDLMTTTMGQAYMPLKPVTGEGIQYDNSYFQHGKQLYIGGYGDELLKGVLMFANYTVGTEYELKGAPLETLSYFARNTYFKVIRGQNIHMNVLGRGVSRKGATRKSSSASGFAESLEQRDPLHAAEYNLIKRRLRGEVPANTEIIANNTNYYIGDYVIHTRPEYAFGVRTVSTRTLRNEYGNGEALQIYFMSDGATHITQEGSEYHNIFAVWDWAKIPGVTNPQYAFGNIPKAASDMTTWGTEKLAGGASDSLYSVNTYRLNDSYAGINTQAYKSWFFFDDEVVCLGAGITSSNALEINTTVDQSLLNGEIMVSTASGESVVTRGEYTYNNDLKWVMHNNRGYVFPEGGNLVVKNALQEGNWNKINTTEANSPDQQDVFSVWFNHGIKPKEDKYAYIVVPNKKSVAEMKAYNASNIEILANTDSIQAVHHKGLGIWQLVFTKAATFEYKDMIIKTDNAATMILKNVGTPEVTMHVSDPTQSQIGLVIATLIPSVSTEMKQTLADFYGTGIHAGITKVYTINSSSDKYVPPIKVPVKETVVLKDAVAIADSYIQGNVNAAKGAENRIIVKNDNTLGTRRMGFVRVPLNVIEELEKPEDYDLTISLDMYVFTTNSAAKTTNWTLSPTTSDWDEATVAWNNQPSVATEVIASIQGFDPNKENLENPQNIASFDITAYAFEQYKAGKTDIAFRIYNDKSGAQVDFQLASKEHDNTKLHPKIVIRGTKKEKGEEIETPKRIIEYAPGGDAYVESKGQENYNYGKSKQLQMKNMLGGISERISYLQYDLTKLKISNIETIGKAFLRFYLTSAETDANKVYWTLHKTNNTEWSEDVVTYKIKPIVGEAIAMIAGKAKVSDTEETVEEANYVTFDLTDYILAELEKGTKTLSLALSNHTRYSSSIHGSSFASKEHFVAEKHPVIQAYVYAKEGGGPPIEGDGTAITELTINGQTWTTNQTFVVPKEYTNKKITVNITAEVGATISTGSIVEVDVTNPSVQDIEIEIVDADGVTKKTHILKVEKRFSFNDLVFVQWNNTMSAKNTPLIHGYTFSAYQWYKNGLPIYGATRQFYSVGYNGEAINPSDTYFVEVTDSATGNKMRCWESHVELKSMDTKAYPNPVNSGESINVSADIASDLLEGARIELYNMNGFRIKTEPVIGQITTIAMPSISGTYILKLVATNGYTKSLKVVVK